jgi:ABC-type dipeptide/oligopeptide/nickel transport system permease component
MILEQLPSTVELAVGASIVGFSLGLLLGLAAALRRSTWIDSAATGLAVVSLATPTYWSGLLAILLFSLLLGWLPSTGQGDLRHLILPACVLGFATAGSIARVVRAQVIQVLRQPFVLAAHGRGLTRSRILLNYVLRNALGAALAVAALQFGFLLSGAVITEAVFARQGLGQLTVQAIFWRDLPVARGMMVVAALAFVLSNLAADLIRAGLDPRQREGLG